MPALRRRPETLEKHTWVSKPTDALALLECLFKKLPANKVVVVYFSVHEDMLDLERTFTERYQDYLTIRLPSSHRYTFRGNVAFRFVSSKTLNLPAVRGLSPTDFVFVEAA